MSVIVGTQGDLAAQLRFLVLDLQCHLVVTLRGRFQLVMRKLHIDGSQVLCLWLGEDSAVLGFEINGMLVLHEYLVLGGY